MTVSEWIAESAERLRSADFASPGLEAQLLAAHALGVERVWLFAHPEAEFPVFAGEHLVQRRLAGEPIAYLLGWREFYGRRFTVDRRVLIPRHETEILVDTALASTGVQRVLDVGTGSGCVAATLALEKPGWEIWAADLSPEALDLAEQNARDLRASVRFVLSDRFSGLGTRRFDLIVSNPPYVSRADPLPAEVRDWEPSLALFAEEDGLAFYRRLAEEAPAHLAPGGTLLLELGDRSWPAIQNVFGPEWTLDNPVPDLAGTPRVLAGRITPNRVE